MKRANFLSGILLCVGVALGGTALAQSTRSTPAIEQLFRQSVSAIDSGELRQATQLLTRLTSLPEHVHSERSQELLGNVREQRGQLAHAVEEYRIFLQKYPDSSGVPRVRRRLEAILQGGRNTTPDPSAIPAQTGDALADASADINRQGAAPRSSRVRTPAPEEPARDPSEYVITDRGRFALTYRYNESTTEIQDLDPAPGELEDEEFFFDNTLSASLYFSRIMENDARRMVFTFSGSADFDLDGDDDESFRLYEASGRIEDKGSGRATTFGRFRLRPTGIAYRLDGVSVDLPLSSGPTLGLFAGGVVESTRDTPFEDGRYLFGASVTFEEVGGEDADLAFYLVEQRDGSYTDRRALGAEYTLNRDWGGLFVNAEYDINFNELNRFLITGTRVLSNQSRITGRFNHYRSPLLTLQNALIGQTATSIDDLRLAFTLDEIEQLAIDRSSKVTTLGLNYYGALNDTWDLSLDGTLYYTSGTPASGGVAAVENDGVRGYFGARVIGTSVFSERDRVDFGLRYSYSDDFNQYVFDTSTRFNVNDDLSVRPRVQVGYRDNTNDPGFERFVLPSVNARYRLNRETSFQVEAGGRWTWAETATDEIDTRQYFVTAGFVRSF